MSDEVELPEDNTTKINSYYEGRNKNFPTFLKRRKFKNAFKKSRS